MNIEQRCPHCSEVNKVAGIWQRGPLFNDQPNILCGFCGKEFQPKNFMTVQNSASGPVSAGS
jgi:phage FluMu protein Com